MPRLREIKVDDDEYIVWFRDFSHAEAWRDLLGMGKTDNTSRIDDLEDRFRILEAEIRADLEMLAKLLAKKESVSPVEHDEKAVQNRIVIETVKTTEEE